MSINSAFTQRLLILAASMICALAVGRGGANAGVPTDAVVPYSGPTSDGGTALVNFQYGIFAYTSFGFGGSLPRGCQTVYSSVYALLDDGVHFGAVGRHSVNLTNVAVLGYVDSITYRSIAGLVMADGPAGSECGNHRAVWIATNDLLRTPSVSLDAAAQYSGAVTLHQSPTTIGRVSLTTGANGDIRSFVASAVIESCTYTLDTGMLTAPLKFDGAGVLYQGTNGAMAGVMRDKGLAGVALMSTAGCPDLPVAWSASAPASQSPTGTPGPVTPPVAVVPPTSAGHFLNAPTFGSGTNASAVFSGGSIDALEAAAKGATANGVWVQDASGSFELLVVGAPAFLRDSFVAKFPSGITGPLAVTLVK